ncbi:MAG TPA: 3-deoxy-7-phosphoheptulonate synthase [Solirubrobacteraceae bacterium]|nr:3-deoxy-7-phosphoheptulonate synthase [Solirubrobacteraceae bacterium]
MAAGATRAVGRAASAAPASERGGSGARATSAAPASERGGSGARATSGHPGLARSGAVRDQRIERVEALVAPADLLDELPLQEDHVGVVLGGREQVRAVLDGADDRLLVVVGPCSVHDVDATLEYASRLARLKERLREDLCLAMRVYFEKPRTTVGWKGLINDPHLDGSGDVNTGLRMARRLLLDVLGLGLPVGCEFLDPITPQYISDAVCWGAIGARTVESQIHRQLGSGLSMPVGFKNRTDGNVQVAVDAVRAAAVPHAFAGIDVAGTPAILYTSGNRDCHVILRGGRGAPNHHPPDVASALELLSAAGLPRRLMIDLSHDNSGKDPARQPAVAEAVAAQIAGGARELVGVMVESFLVPGRQELGDGRLVYGQSITDGCLGWEQTVDVLAQLAAAVRARRAGTAGAGARPSSGRADGG